MNGCSLSGARVYRPTPVLQVGGFLNLRAVVRSYDAVNDALFGAQMARKRAIVVTVPSPMGLAGKPAVKLLCAGQGHLVRSVEPTQLFDGCFIFHNRLDLPVAIGYKTVGG